MRTLKFKAQPTNAFFATVNQEFGGSSQLSTADQIVVQSSDNEQSSAVVVSSVGGPAEHLIDGSEKRICWLSF